MTPEAEPYIERLDAVKKRLEAHVAAAHAGKTDPDAGTGERWSQGQIWAHLAEFIPYWIPQVEKVIAGAGGEAVLFGRTKKDEGRIAAIEDGKDVGVATHWERLSPEIVRLRAFLGQIPSAAWQTTGIHPSLGPMPLPRIIHEFLVGHLEEHADQLDGLDA